MNIKKEEGLVRAVKAPGRIYDADRLAHNSKPLQEMRWKAKSFKRYGCKVAIFHGCENVNGWSTEDMKASLGASKMALVQLEVLIDIGKKSYLIHKSIIHFVFGIQMRIRLVMP